MKLISVTTLATIIAVANAVELTPDNYVELTAGKTIFLKFFSPNCGHCKRMKPAWDHLMDEYADSVTQLVAEVDCTGGGRPLCEANGIRGYPTMKWGDPAAMNDYKGGREFDTLKAFADENLKPICSPTHLDLCDESKKEEIKSFMNMSTQDLEKQITDKEHELEKVEDEFKSFVTGLQSQYQEAMEHKDKALNDIKNSGLGLMKAVKALAKNVGSDEL